MLLRLKTKCLLFILPLAGVSLVLLAGTLVAYGTFRGQLRTFRANVAKAAYSSSFATAVTRQTSESLHIAFGQESDDEYEEARRKAHHALASWKRTAGSEDAGSETELARLLQVERLYSKLEPALQRIIELGRAGKEEAARQSIINDLGVLVDDSLLLDLEQQSRQTATELLSSLDRLIGSFATLGFFAGDPTEALDVVDYDCREILLGGSFAASLSRQLLEYTTTVLTNEERDDLYVARSDTLNTMNGWKELVVRRHARAEDEELHALLSISSHLSQLNLQGDEVLRLSDEGKTEEAWGILTGTMETMADKSMLFELDARLASEQVELEESLALLLHQVSHVTKSATIVTILVLAIGIVSPWLLSNTVVRPICALTEAATDLGAGKVVRQVEVTSKDELGQLGETFNSMAAQLSRVQQNLEETVRERTSAFESTNARLQTEIDQRRNAEEALRWSVDEARALNHLLLAISDVHRALWVCRSARDVASVLTGTLVEKFSVLSGRVWLVGKCEEAAECQFKDQCRSQPNCLHLASSSGHYTKTDEKLKYVPLGTLRIGKVAQYGNKIIVTDVSREDRTQDPEWEGEHGLRSFAGLPLKKHGKVVGVLAAVSQEKMKPNVLEALDILAGLGAAALENVEQVNTLKRADAAKSDFLANMSHEIRTPMTAILGFIEEIISTHPDLDDQESGLCDHLRTISRNARSLLQIINDFLDLAKIDMGTMSVRKVRCNPCQTVAEIASLMRVRSDAKSLSFQSDYEGTIPETIVTDPARLRQILIILLGNAIRFTESGSIRLLTRLTNAEGKNRLEFDVIDTGQGMTEENAERLSRPFSQFDTAPMDDANSAGLGLSIGRRLADLLGGDITLVQTAEGLGTTFRASVATGALTGVDMLENPTEATVLSDEFAAYSESQLSGCSILLAEDGHDNQRLIAHVLKKAGARVAVVENGKLAIDAAQQARDDGEPFDIILMDMQMPILDGYKATTMLRQREYDGPIIALTAHAIAGDREKCLSVGCDEYVTKPVDRGQLIATIREYLPAHSDQSPS